MRFVRRMKRVIFALIIAALSLCVMSCATTGERDPNCVSVVKDFFDKAPDNSELMPPIHTEVGSIFYYLADGKAQVLCLVTVSTSCVSVGDSKRTCRVRDGVQLFYGGGQSEIPKGFEPLPSDPPPI